MKIWHETESNTHSKVNGSNPLSYPRSARAGLILLGHERVALLFGLRSPSNSLANVGTCALQASLEHVREFVLGHIRRRLKVQFCELVVILSDDAAKDDEQVLMGCCVCESVSG